MLVKIRGAQHDHNLAIPNAEPSWTVLQLKEAIAQAHVGESPLSVDAMRLIFAGRVMAADTQTLADFNIQDEQTVHMVVRPAAAPAGGNGPSPADGNRPQEGLGVQPQQQQQRPPAPTTMQQLGGPLLGDILSQFGPALGQIMPIASAALAQGMQRMMPPADANGGSALPNAPAQPQPQQQPQAQPQPQPQAQAQAFAQAQAQQAHAQAVHAAHIAAHQQAVQQQQLQQLMAMQQAAAARAAPPVPPPAAVQVHVHVSLAELDELPARLQTFYQRMAPAQVTVRVEQQQPAATGPTPGQQQQPTNTGAQRQAPQPPVAGATQQQQQQQQQQRPAAQPSQPPAAPATPQHQQQPQAPPAQQPRPNLNQIVAAAGMPASDAPPTNMFDALQQEVMHVMEIADLMRMINGDWSPVLKARPAVVEHVRRELAADPAPGNHARLAAKTAKQLVTELVDNAELRALFLQRQKPHTPNIFRTLENGLFAMSLDFLHLLLEEPVPSTFTQRLRLLLVKFVGVFMDYFPREVLTHGMADLEAVVQSTVRIVIQEVARTNAQMAAFAPMAGGMAMNTLIMWRNEYMQVHRRAGDDAIFTTEPRVPAAPAAPPAAAAAAASSPSSAPPPAVAVPAVQAQGPMAVSIDDLLDEALEAQPPAAVARPAAPGDAVSALRTALQDTSLDPRVADAIVAAAAASAGATPELCAAAKGLLPR